MNSTKNHNAKGGKPGALIRWCARLAAVLFTLTATAGPVRLYEYSVQTGELDTNYLVATAISSNILANGLPIAQGIPFRINKNGVATNTFQVGWYSITNRATRAAYVINVFDSGSTVYDFTNVLQSGFNTYVKTVYGTNPPPSADEIEDALGYVPTSPTTLNTVSNVLQVQITELETSGGISSTTASNIVAMNAQGGSANLTNWSQFTTNILGTLGGGSASEADIIASMLTNTAARAVVATNLAFSEPYTAWVSKNGSDTLGTVGKIGQPFLTVSNAVRAVKISLGSAQTNGIVYVGPGAYTEYWVNLQRTNLHGISLIGASPENTMLVSSSTSFLTNLGALVVLGHNSRLVNLTISNDMNFGEKQAAFGWDVSRGTTAGTTFVTPTNSYVGNVVAKGSSDAAYFYDAGSGIYSVWLDNVYLQTKWDALFLNTASTDGSLLVTRSSIVVDQPDGYSFPGGGSGTGRARAAVVGDGNFRIENSVVSVIGGNNATNETTAMTVNNGAGVSYTNVNTAISAQSRGSGSVLLENYTDSPEYIGRLTPGVISTNAPFSGGIPVASSYRSATYTRDISSGTNIDFAGFSLATKQAITNAGTGGSAPVYPGFVWTNGLSTLGTISNGVSIYGTTTLGALTARANSTWSFNSLTQSYASGPLTMALTVQNVIFNPTDDIRFVDNLGGTPDTLMRIVPDASDIALAEGFVTIRKLYATNVFGDGSGLTALNGSSISSGTVDPARLGSGSSITTKYLRGDSTWQTISGGGDALTSGTLAQFAATTSADLRGVLSDESGTGVFLTANGSGASLTGLTASQIGPSGAVSNLQAFAEFVALKSQVFTNGHAQITNLHFTTGKGYDLSLTNKLSTTNDLYVGGNATIVGTTTAATINATTVTGAGTSLTFADDTIDGTWNGETTAGNKNNIHDWLVQFDTDYDGKPNFLDLGAGIPKTDPSGALSLAAFSDIQNLAPGYFVTNGMTVTPSINGNSITNVKLGSIVSMTNTWGSQSIDFAIPETTTNASGGITFALALVNANPTNYNYAVRHVRANGANRTVTIPTGWSSTRTAHVVTNGGMATFTVTAQIGLFTNISQVDYTAAP